MMTHIVTQRLTIKPTHKNCWSIYDKLDSQMIGKLFFKNQWFNIILKPQSLRLGVATEASYGLMKAINNDFYKARTDVPHAKKFLLDMGFINQGNHFSVTAENLKCPNNYQQLCDSLGIEPSKLSNQPQDTAAQLVDSDLDCFKRPTKLHPQAHSAWQKLQQSAHSSGVNLKLVSAFRSINYQAKLIRNKLDLGMNLNDILSTNTAPGHSQHHTGCAIDLTTSNHPPLEESFDSTDAFKWLKSHAQKFGFIMSYPQDNDEGIIYEPWHWFYQPPNQTN